MGRDSMRRVSESSPSHRADLARAIRWGITMSDLPRHDETAQGEPRRRPRDLSALVYVDEAIRLTTSRMPTIDPQAMRLNMSLTRVVNARARVSELAVTAGANWSWSAFRVMYAVWLFEPIEARDIARLLELNRQTVASAVASLRRAGMLEVDHAAATDGRLVPLRLTADGRAVVEPTILRQNRLAARWASVLEPDELDLLIGLLGRLAAPADDAEAADGLA